MTHMPSTRLDTLFAAGAAAVPDGHLRPLTELARSLFGTRMAHVSILDRNWQWFKAACGLAADCSSREDAICSYAVAAQAPLIVPDARADPRFADNPFVTDGPAIRFYAGVPLHDPETGEAVGTFCVTDDRPGSAEAVDAELLQRLARLAERQIAEFSSALRRDLVERGRDPVTGLADPVWLDYRLQAALADAQAAGSGVAVLVAQVERLREVAFARGAVEANRVLAELGNRLAEGFGADATVGRLDEETFLAICPVRDPRRDLAALAEPGRAAFAAPVEVEDERIAVRGRIGASMAPLDAGETSGLIAAARQALEAAPRDEAAGIQVYDPSLTQALNRDLSVERRLGETLRGGTGPPPEPVYQPQVAPASGGVLGAEALARWHDSELGRVSPGDFIPIAERSGLIHELGHRLQLAAAGEAAAWGTGKVAVNVAAAELVAPTFVQHVDHALAATGLPGERLVLEVTEGALVDDTGAVARTLRRLRKRGISFAVDDFGTGYSAFRYLRDLPVQTLKIDRSFVDAVAESASDRRILAAMIAMGHELGLEVVAEGVETEAQRAVVAELGADAIQGFLVAPGLPAAEFRARLGTTPLATAQPTA